MKLSEYIKDQIIPIIFYFIFNFIFLFFLFVFKTNLIVIIILSCFYFIYGISVLIYSYIRRKRFYDLMLYVSSNIDQKNLLHSTLYEPSFLDGKILYQIIYDTDKYTTETLKEYKNQMEEFREYIELWLHEVKIPLSSTKLLIHNHKDSKIKNVNVPLEQLENYLDQILYYVRSETVEKDYIIKEVNLKDIINKVIVKNKDSFINNKIKIELEESYPNVKTDSKWLEFIINQIIQNSIKYRKGNSKIIINSKKELSYYELVIEDNGIGISKNDLPRVFEKGFTGDNGRVISTSTGIGLYLCNKLCEKLGHKIKITSELNKGTKVTIIIPKNKYYHLED